MGGGGKSLGIKGGINGGINGGAPGKNGGKLMLFGDSTLIGDGIVFIESFGAGNPSIVDEIVRIKKFVNVKKLFEI